MRSAVATLAYGAVGRQWPNSTMVCMATGPSLTQADVDACRGKARVIAIKDAYDLAPWADVVYGAGVDRTKWWQRNGDRVAREHAGLRFTLDPLAAKWATVLRWGTEQGLSTEPDRLALGRNSGYQAINLATLLGATRVVLLGYDMKMAGSRENFFDGQSKGPSHRFAEWRQFFATLVDPLKSIGVSVINSTPDSALDCFPKIPLTEALC